LLFVGFTFIPDVDTIYHSAWLRFQTGVQ